MSFELMNKIASQVNAESDEFSFEHSDQLTSPGNGPWVLIPNGIDNIAVTLSISAGSGKVQITNDLDATVRTGAPVAVDWPLGGVSGTVEDSCKPVTAIRQVNYSGTTTLSMRAQ